ncbi:MAG TPA: hypothetical protein VN634_18445 [Candidatus Limnocylindrales bacterium]|nr:hypothetical protein [Candidatus Limnocylindrales bacterium]
MDALYKYMSTASLDELLDGGRIRIGTLDEYRDTCSHSDEVADRKEGSRRIVVDVSPGANPRAEAERVVRDHRLDENDNSDVRVENHRDSVVVEARSPNLYLFSASLRCDRDLMSTLGYDACVKIASPEKFFRSLTGAMSGVRSFLGFREVIYEDPHCPKARAAGVHPAFFKRADYSHQAEVRALWEPDAPRIEPVIVSCPEAAGLCELCLSR